MSWYLFELNQGFLERALKQQVTRGAQHQPPDCRIAVEIEHCWRWPTKRVPEIVPKTTCAGGSGLGHQKSGLGIRDRSKANNTDNAVKKNTFLLASSNHGHTGLGRCPARQATARTPQSKTTPGANINLTNKVEVVPQREVAVQRQPPPGANRPLRGEPGAPTPMAPIQPSPGSIDNADRDWTSSLQSCLQHKYPVPRR